MFLRGFILPEIPLHFLDLVDYFLLFRCKSKIGFKCFLRSLLSGTPIMWILLQFNVIPEVLRLSSFFFLYSVLCQWFLSFCLGHLSYLVILLCLSSLVHLCLFFSSSKSLQTFLVFSPFFLEILDHLHYYYSEFSLCYCISLIHVVIF